MRKNEYYQRMHDESLKTLAEILRKVKQGMYWMVSVEFKKNMGDDGYRIVVHLRERK